MIIEDERHDDELEFDEENEDNMIPRKASFGRVQLQKTSNLLVEMGIILKDSWIATIIPSMLIQTFKMTSKSFYGT